MPQGQPGQVPQGGLTTRSRRNRPLTIVHIGQMKGKSTAAFGLAMRGWNQGWNIGVFQFVKSAKWKVGAKTALLALGGLHESTGVGGPVQWHKMGEGWSWTRKPGSGEDPAAAALGGSRQIQRRIAAQTHDLYVLDEFTHPMKWGWFDVDEVVATLRGRPGHQHVVITGQDAAPALLEVADLVTEMTKDQATDGLRTEGPAGDRAVTASEHRAASVQKLWPAARAEGIGVGWVSFFDPDELAAEPNLPAHLNVVAYLCVGHVEQFPNSPELATSGWARRRPWPGQSMMEPMALVAYLEENLCPC